MRKGGRIAGDGRRRRLSVLSCIRTERLDDPSSEGPRRTSPGAIHIALAAYVVKSRAGDAAPGASRGAGAPTRGIQAATALDGYGAEPRPCSQIHPIRRNQASGSSTVTAISASA